MVIAAHTFRPLDKILSVSAFTGRAPNNVLQPSGAHRVTTQLKVFRTHEVQQDQRPYTAQFIVVAQPGNIMATAVGVVWSVGLTTLVPFFAKRFLAVKEDQPICQFWFLLTRAQYSA